MNIVSFGGCVGCPMGYGYAKERHPLCGMVLNGDQVMNKGVCRECWDRPVEEDSKEEK